MSSQAGTPTVALDRRRRAESNPQYVQSPVWSTTNQAPTNGYHNEPYSLEFLQLYEDDPGHMPMQANLFNTIGITSSLSCWLNDRDALAQATNGRSPQEVFHRLDRPFESLNFPDIQKHVREDRNTVVSGRHPVWQYLTVDSSVPEEHVVGELKGQIGHMHDYCQDPVNRWQTLRHPVPFVFFHPQLPIYIDTRNEGTLCRYVRRSCRPNLKMKTVLTDEREFHFCFVATEPLEAGTEITIGWVLDENIRKYLDRAHFGTRGDGSIKQEGLAEAEADYISLWVGKVLADFGGCACNSPQHCTLAQFDRRRSTASIDSAVHLPNGRSKKAKHGLINNPSYSTCQAPGSRACSETLKYREEDDHDESRSTSGSTHSKPHSRDMTPTARFSTDLGPVPGPELSDREKRKIAAAERTFEQLAQDNKAQKRKKRTGGGSHPNTPSVGASVRSAKALQVVVNYANPPSQKQLGQLITSTSQPNTPDSFSKPNYVNSKTSRRRSCSPTSRTLNNSAMRDEASNSVPQGRVSLLGISSPSTRPARLHYVDSVTQTEQDQSDARGVLSPSATSKRKSYVPLTRRLLQRCHEDRIRLEHENKIMGDEAVEAKGPTLGTAQIPEDSFTQSNVPVQTPIHVEGLQQGDVEMKDVDPEPTQISINNPPDMTLEKPRPPDEPSATFNPSPFDRAPSIKPPPPPWPSSGPEVSIHSSASPNGYRPLNLRVQLPPTPLFSSNINTTTPGSVTNTSTGISIAQSPSTLGSHSYSPPFPSSVTQVVQPSPVKKKLSLGDYMSRKGIKAEVPSAEKGQQANSPTTPQTMFRHSATIKEQVSKPTSDAQAIVESPRTEDQPDPLTASDDPGG